MKYLSFLMGAIISTLSGATFAQIKISPPPGTPPHASAMLEVEATNKGFLLPRMSSAARTGIVGPASGLLVYDSTENEFYYWNGGSWVKFVNNFFFNGGKNTLNQAYNQGGPGAGRVITGISGALEVNSNGLNHALQLTNSGIMSGLFAQTTDGNAVDVTSGTGAGIMVNKTGTGYGLRAYSSMNGARDLISVRMAGNQTNSFREENGRAGYFIIDNGSNPLPALQGSNFGTGHGLLGSTGTLPSLSNVSLPRSGVVGITLIDYDRRNGVTGHSRNGNGGFGFTGTNLKWADGPDSIYAGLYGKADLHPDVSGMGMDQAGVVGTVKQGVAVSGINRGGGHGVIGVLFGSENNPTQAGVWGVVPLEGQSWAQFVASNPFYDNGFAKERVGVLGQVGEYVAVWGESLNYIGMVATTGVKRSKASLPITKMGLYAANSHADGVAAMFQTENTTSPTVGVLSKSSFAGLQLMQQTSGAAMRITKDLAGPGIEITHTGSGPDMDNGFGMRINMTNAINTSTALDVLHHGKGFGIRNIMNNPDYLGFAILSEGVHKGGIASFTNSNGATLEPTLKVTQKGASHAGLFLSEKVGAGVTIQPATVVVLAKNNSVGLLVDKTNIGGEPALEVKSTGAYTSRFTSSNTTGSLSANYMQHNAPGHVLEVVNERGALASNAAAVLKVEGSHGFVAHFEDKNTNLSLLRTDPVVKISAGASRHGLIGLHVEGSFLGIGNLAAKFDGGIEVGGKITIGGGLSTISGAIDFITSKMTVSGPSKLDGAVEISNAVQANGALTVEGPTTINDFFKVNGNLEVTGSITGSSKSFLIDHPLYPGKLLRHASTESNEMLVQYSGNVVTNSDGFATVEMPVYLKALAADFRYHLTIVDKTFAQAIVYETLEENNVRFFRIRTNIPGIKVSWQVTGARIDKYAKENPMQVEE